MTAASNFHKLRDGGDFLGDAEMIDHHRNHQRMRVAQQRGKNKRSRTGGSRIRWAREFTHRQILQIPFPTRQRSWQSALQSFWIGRSEHFDCGTHSLPTCFVQSGFEKVQHRYADRSQQARNWWQKFAASRFRQQSGQAVQQPFRVANQQPRQSGIKRAIGERSVHQEQPTVLCDQPVRQSVHVFKLRFTWRLFES